MGGWVNGCGGTWSAVFWFALDWSCERDAGVGVSIVLFPKQNHTPLRL